MNKANGNEPAYPGKNLNRKFVEDLLELRKSGLSLSMQDVNELAKMAPGMTKREVIAKDILSGIVSMTSPPTKWQIENRALYLSETSMLAVDLADALLEALEKETD